MPKLKFREVTVDDLIAQVREKARATFKLKPEEFIVTSMPKGPTIGIPVAPAPLPQPQKESRMATDKHNRLNQQGYIKLSRIIEQYVASKPQRKTWAQLLALFSQQMQVVITKSNVETVADALGIATTDIICPETKNTPFGVVSSKVHALEDQVAALTKRLDELEKLIK